MPLLGMAGSSVIILPWLKALETAAEHEFEAFEVFGEFPQCVCQEVGHKEREEGRALVKASGIELIVHAPFTSLNIAAMNPGIRRESSCQLVAAVDFCADLGGDRVVVHAGDYVYPERSRQRAGPAFEMQWSYNVESLQEVCERAEQRGVLVCLENSSIEPEHIDKCPDDMLKIKEEVRSDALAFCLDIGHARLKGQLEEAIRKLAPDVRHIHFTDNMGEDDDHVAIGEGNIDYTPFLDFFKNFEGVMTLEVLKVGTDPGTELKSRDYVRELLS